MWPCFSGHACVLLDTLHFVMLCFKCEMIRNFGQLRSNPLSEFAKKQSLKRQKFTAYFSSRQFCGVIKFHGTIFPMCLQSTLTHCHFRGPLSQVRFMKISFLLHLHSFFFFFCIVAVQAEATLITSYTIRVPQHLPPATEANFCL